MKGKWMGDEVRKGSKNAILLVLVGMAFLAHLALMVPIIKGQSKLFIWADSICYEKLAINLLAGKGYSVSETPPHNPNSTMTPGYPLFIAAVYSVFGQSPYIVIIIQILLSLAITLWIIRWGVKKYTFKTGLLAGSLVLLDICLAFYSTQIMSDLLCLSLLVPGFWLAIRLFEGGSWKTGIGAGFLFGMTALVRPIGLYFPLVLALLLLIKPREGSAKRRLFGYALLLLIHIAIVSPWFVRNKIVFNHVFFSTIQSFNLSHIHAAPLKATIEGKTDFDAEHDLEVSAFARYGQPRNEAEKFIFTGREAARYVFAHPLPYLKLYFAGIARTILPMGPGEFRLFYSSSKEGFRNLTPSIYEALLHGRLGKAFTLLWKERIAPTQGFFFIYVAAFIFKMTLIALSIITFLKSGGFRTIFNLLFFTSVVYFIGVTGPAGQPRHFLPLIPFVALLAARLFFLKKEIKKQKEVAHEG